jgi:hypothetical protein
LTYPFLGDVIIARAPNVKWTFFEKGAKDVSFQRHVLSGFTKVQSRDGPARG